MAVDDDEQLEQWVSRYQPEFTSSVTQPALERLDRFVGQRLVQVWVLWDGVDDEIFTDAPILFEFESGKILELCCHRLDEFSITVGTVDRSVKPLWFGGDEWSLSWRALSVVRDVEAIGRHLTCARLVEYKVHRQWSLFGAQLSFDRHFIVIYNGLDENKIAFEPLTGPKYRRRGLPTVSIAPTQASE